MSRSYARKNVLITGGLGFIGSNLAIRLVELGAQVTIVDSSVEGCGGNAYNMRPIAGSVRLLRRDITAAAQFGREIGESHVIFNLAGEISHIHSMKWPERDARLNASAQLRFLVVCAEHAPGVRVVYAGTRQIYGIPRYLPVDEDHPVHPVDFNGIHNYAAVMYHELFSRSGQLDCVVLNLTNVYGPRMALDIPCQGFLANFMRRLALRQPLKVFGDGTQLRDPLYVADAVEAFVRAGSVRALPSRAYNVGGPEPLELREIARTASAVAGVAPPSLCPFPPEQKAIDIGSYSTNWTRIRRELGWEPAIRFDEGIRRTLAYYRTELSHYLNPATSNPACKLPLAKSDRRRAFPSV